MKKILIDSNYLVALADPQDGNRPKALEFAATITDQDQLMVPDVALTEVTFLINRYVSFRAVLTFLDTIADSSMQIEPITKADIKRGREIMAKYADTRLDFVDVCLMALAERLNITRICTFDRRDFSIFRPNHCDYLELLP